jgi:hypothetical protein
VVLAVAVAIAVAIAADCCMHAVAAGCMGAGAVAADNLGTVELLRLHLSLLDLNLGGHSLQQGVWACSGVELQT